MGLHAYLLAAGRGRRMGQPKAWLEFEGRTLLERQVEFLAGRFGAAVAVSVQEGWLTRARALHAAVTWVPVDPELTALGALQELLRRAPPSDWASVHHVDMPLWERGLFDDLERSIPAAAAGRAHAVVPVSAGRRGHPVLLSASAARELLAADPRRERLDAWLRARRAHLVETAFPCALANWNQPHQVPSSP